METAPLTLAHTHARNAVLETRKSNPVAASEEHDLAAGEFAAVARSSSDHEGLRTLQLLENHHKKLAQILRFQHEHPPAAAVAETSSPGASPALNSQPSTGESGTGTIKASPSAQDASQQPPRLPGNPARLPARETSSIASNLAYARGIPSHPRRASPVSPTLSSQQAGAKMTETPTKLKSGESRLRSTQGGGQKERLSRASAPKQPWSPPSESPTDVTSQQPIPPGTVDSRQTSRPAVAEEPFQRFYSTFEGFISKISAPLAFAGLPLGAQSAVQTGSNHSRKSSAETKLDRHPATSDRHTPATEPDVNRLFSRAALRAVRDTTGGGGMGNTAESFYVVPTTGGTVSYAGILSRAEKEARRNSLDDAEDDFVDARETPSSPEIRRSQDGLKGKASRGTDKFPNSQNPKSMEELQMENQALRHLSDTLSKRLHMWEVNAQSSSLALQQSLKAMHHQSAPSPEGLPLPSPSGPGDVTTALATAASMTEHEQRVKELEDLVRFGEKELDKVGRENEKLRTVVGRYRERWEKLKEGAKTRRAEGKAGGDAAADSPNIGAGPASTTRNTDSGSTVRTDVEATPTLPEEVGNDLPVEPET